MSWITGAGRRIVGWIDGVHDGRLHGWVLDRCDPMRRLAVGVDAPHLQRVVVFADRYRTDLQQNSFGDGHYGFAVPIHRFHPAASLKVVCLTPETLLGTVDLSTGRFAANSPSFTRRGSVRMQVDRMRGAQEITGWAFDDVAPEHRRVIRLRTETTIVAQQRATLYRPDMLACDCDPYHGFRFPLPTKARRKLILEDVATNVCFPVVIGSR